MTTTENTKAKRKSVTRAIFYVMAALLLVTTGLCCYLALSVSSIKKDLSSDLPAVEISTDNPEDLPVIATPDNTYDEETVNSLKEASFNQGRENVLSSIKDMMQQGSTTLKMLRTMYPDYLIYNEPQGYIFTPVNTSLRMHSYNPDNFKMKLNDYDIPVKVEYYDNNILSSYTGIDVSSHNGSINWNKVKNDGIDFAIIRGVVRGYGAEGKLVTDKKFDINAAGATAAGIPIGVYVFSEATTTEEALEEANLVLSMIEPYDITYPVIIDIEDIADDTGRNESLSPDELTDVVLTFCDTIRSAGYTPMLYCNLKGFIGMLNFERLEGIEKWYAYYGDNLYFPYDVSMWQYSSTGKVDGISGNVDLNISFKNYE